MEVDELGSFIGAKREPWWVWTALDSRTRQVVEMAVGERDEFTARCSWESLPPAYRQRTIVATDLLPVYQAVVPEDGHATGGKERGVDRTCGTFFRDRASALCACGAEDVVVFAEDGKPCRCRVVLHPILQSMPRIGPLPPWRIMQIERNEPTPEMIAFYERRTNEHIERVRRCLMLLAEVTDYGEELIERAKVHDTSKFGPEERIPYVWLTEYHRCRRNGESFEYPEGIADRVKKAIHHHVISNRHHPDFHPVPNDMTEVDLIEMVCDWTAMAQEFGQDGGSARGWADKTIGKRIGFNEEKRRFIYQMIEELDRQIAADSTRDH